LSAALLGRSISGSSTTAIGDSVVVVDLKAPPEDLLAAAGEPDVLIHLAWGGLPHYESLHHFEEELPAQYAFLKTLVSSGLKSVVVTGTCFEYGMQSGALHEGLEARPGNAYGYAKNALRIQLEYLQRVTPFNLTWLRLFYLYGSGQADTSLFSQLRAAVERGDKTFKMSGGDQVRDYLPVSIAVRNIVSLALTQRDNGIVNVCSAEPVSVRKLVEGWIAENDWSIDLELGYYPYADYEPMAFWGDRTKMDRCLEQGGE
jgi:dTDP-6-deoxy-L-talose 4-dehydrogenase (NAD+)